MKPAYSAATYLDAKVMMLDRCYGVVMMLAFLGGILSQAYIPFTDVPVYFLECALLAVAVLVDAIYRRAPFAQTLSYFLASLAVAPLAVARWYANRPLKHNEVRKGGVHTNFFNAFALITIVFTGVSAACNFLAFGPERGFEIIINAGFSVAGTALVIGLMTRQDKVTERGRQRLPKGVEGELD